VLVVLFGAGPPAPPSTRPNEIRNPDCAIRNKPANIRNQ
jgi:hypothetical protein